MLSFRFRSVRSLCKPTTKRWSSSPAVASIFSHYDPELEEEKNRGLTKAEIDFHNWVASKRNAGTLSIAGAVVKKTPDGGYGLFARRDIKASEELVRVDETLLLSAAKAERACLQVSFTKRV